MINGSARTGSDEESRATSRHTLDDQHLLAGPLVVDAVFAAIAYVASLFPSTALRSNLFQGFLVGITSSLGYLAGAGLAALARLHEIGKTGFHDKRRIRRAGFTLVAGLAAYGMGVLPDWANSARVLMQVPPVDTVHCLFVALLTASVALALVMTGRIFPSVMRMCLVPSCPSGWP